MPVTDHENSKFILRDASYVLTGHDAHGKKVNVFKLTDLFKSACQRHGFGINQGTTWEGAGIVEIIPRHEVAFSTFRAAMEEVTSANQIALSLAAERDKKGVRFMHYQPDAAANKVCEEAILATAVFKVIERP